ELLPRASHATNTSPRRWLLLTGVATSAAAAAVVLSLLMSRVFDLPRPWRGDASQRAVVDWLPIAPESFPVPKFEAPAVNRYPKIALPKLDLTPLPELPARSVDWLRRARHSIASA